LDSLKKRSNAYTVFVPDTTAIKGFLAAATGQAGLATASNQVVSSFILSSLPASTAYQIVSYNIVPQKINPYGGATTAFANLAMPSLLNPVPGNAATALLRLDVYLAQGTAGAYINNIPVVAANIASANGIIHHTAAIAVPPSQFLWNRINADANLTFLKAAILRADSGQTNVPGVLNQNILQSVLSNIGPDLTIFAPTDQAFKNVLYVTAYPIVYGQLYQAAYAQAIGGGASPTMADAAATAYATANAPAQTTALTSSPTVFQNPALYPYLTAQNVKGILVSNFLGVRAFTNNLPATAINVPTLLNGAIPTHPGITIKSTFTGPIASSATVKGAYNPSASNILINNLPAPYGTSDQIYLNGVLHEIDQVLIPLPL
jgi:uncharacterized surface protein with fasciclin (FAS1) repeats